ncbi:MAG: transcription termination/antitermination protein NusA, partial [Acidimicrobiales bacterium]
MKDNYAFLEALNQIARDKGISTDILLDALANALVAAYKRLPTAAEEAVVTIDPDTGDIRVYGQELDEDGNVTREWDDTPDDFGRIAAQTAKQVILQRIREAERDQKYEEYAGREGDIVTGMIQQSDNRYTLLSLGNVEALLPQAEQVPYERYEHNARLKAYIVEVRKTTKGPQIVVSRTHPGIITRLFLLVVPEISSGVVEIMAAARDPGARTKIAVWSNDSNVDPVGACVGARGARVRMVTNELRGEK